MCIYTMNHCPTAHFLQSVGFVHLHLCLQKIVKIYIYITKKQGSNVNLNI